MSSSSVRHREIASAIVIDKFGRFLLQQRDNVVGIIHPGKVGLFGPLFRTCGPIHIPVANTGLGIPDATSPCARRSPRYEQIIFNQNRLNSCAERDHCPELSGIAAP
jgi:hypothetical protein